MRTLPGIPVTIVSGNPIDGFQFVGPFATSEDAVEFGNTLDRDTDWWIAPLYPPVSSAAGLPHE
jgi:hypothetical protein